MNVENSSLKELTLSRFKCFNLNRIISHGRFMQDTCPQFFFLNCNCCFTTLSLLSSYEMIKGHEKHVMII